MPIISKAELNNTEVVDLLHLCRSIWAQALFYPKGFTSQSINIFIFLSLPPGGVINGSYNRWHYWGGGEVRVVVVGGAGIVVTIILNYVDCYFELIIVIVICFGCISLQ